MVVVVPAIIFYAAKPSATAEVKERGLWSEPPGSGAQNAAQEGQAGGGPSLPVHATGLRCDGEERSGSNRVRRTPAGTIPDLRHL
jgi:hypothetical protein